MLRAVRMISVSRIASSTSVARPLLLTRPLSVFASEAPSAALKQLMKERGNPTTAEEFLDQSVPLGAPKPSALNRLRSAGRNPEAAERRMNDVEAKMRKAQEYKEAKLAAEEKKKAEEAAKKQ